MSEFAITINQPKKPDALIIFDRHGAQIDSLPWTVENHRYALGFVDALFAYDLITGEEHDRLHIEIQTAVSRAEGH